MAPDHPAMLAAVVAPAIMMAAIVMPAPAIVAAAIVAVPPAVAVVAVTAVTAVAAHLVMTVAVGLGDRGDRNRCQAQSGRCRQDQLSHHLSPLTLSGA
jgi:hypothetical protein